MILVTSMLAFSAVIYFIISYFDTTIEEEIKREVEKHVKQIIG